MFEDPDYATEEESASEAVRMSFGSHSPDVAGTSYDGAAFAADSGASNLGWLFWILGFAVSWGLLYLFFVYLPLTFTGTQALLIALGIVFLGGAITRKGVRGALTGFLVFFAPLTAVAVILLVGVAGLAGQVEGIVNLIPLLSAVAVILLIIAAIVAGFVGLVVAGIGGWIGGKIFPLEGRA